jgi:hypothetical protein
MKEDPDRAGVPTPDRDTQGSRRVHRRSLIAVTGALACLATAVVIGVIFTFVMPADNGTIGFELIKFFIQFLLIVALGAFVAVSVETFKRRLDSEDRRRQYEIDTLTSLLDRLDNLYQAVKRERHALSVIQFSQLTYEDYTARMSLLREIKQDAEKIWREMKGLEWIPGLERVWVEIQKMENRLDPAESEWESIARGGDADAAVGPHFKVEQLRELGRFRSGENYLGTPYYKARTMLIELLAERHDHYR